MQNFHQGSEGRGGGHPILFLNVKPGQDETLHNVRGIQEKQISGPRESNSVTFREIIGILFLPLTPTSRHYFAACPGARLFDDSHCPQLEKDEVLVSWINEKLFPWNPPHEEGSTDSPGHPS